jgi:hypothetical protein
MGIGTHSLSAINATIGGLLIRWKIVRTFITPNGLLIKLRKLFLPIKC